MAGLLGVGDDERELPDEPEEERELDQLDDERELDEEDELELEELLRKVLPPPGRAQLGNAMTTPSSRTQSARAMRIMTPPNRIARSRRHRPEAGCDSVRRSVEPGPRRAPRGRQRLPPCAV